MVIFNVTTTRPAIGTNTIRTTRLMIRPIGDHSQIGEWMNLYFGLNGKRQTSNGVLLDLQEYNYAYNQRQSAIDYSRNLLLNVPDVYTFNFKPLTSGYSRLELLDMSGLKQPAHLYRGMDRMPRRWHNYQKLMRRAENL